MMSSVAYDSRPALPQDTIKISIGDGQSSSIVLPRGHDLVKHLERLIPTLAKTDNSSSSFPHGYDAVNALAGLASHAPQHTASLPSQYFPHTSSPSPTPSYTSSSSSSPSHSHYYQPHYYHANDNASAALPQSIDDRARVTGTVRRRRGAPGQASGKKCQFPNCEKISVSRGLCRGHGGGRRCQHPGCAKGAQSRSDFCWAHGGGQRCEVKNCMRSRKSKRFCVAHLSWEVPTSAEVNGSAPTSAAPQYGYDHRLAETPKNIMPKLVLSSPVVTVEEPAASSSAPSSSLLGGSSRLPSLHQLLRQTQCVTTSR